MILYLAMEEPGEPSARHRVLGVFSSLEAAKLRIEGEGPKLPWMEMQGIGRRWWEVGVGGDHSIYEIELNEHL